MVYALLRIPLDALSQGKTRTLLIWIVILLLIPLVFNAAMTGLIALDGRCPRAQSRLIRHLHKSRQVIEPTCSVAYQTYANGTFAEITRQRVYDYLEFSLLGTLFRLVSMCLPCSCLEYIFGKQQIFGILKCTDRCFASCWSGIDHRSDWKCNLCYRHYDSFTLRAHIAVHARHCFQGSAHRALSGLRFSLGTVVGVPPGVSA